MRKEAKLSRVPAPDEESINVAIQFLGMSFDVTAPASQADEISWKWTKFARPLTELYRNSLSYKTVPNLKQSTRRVVAKTKFMLSMSDEKWVFNWSKAQQIMEINVETKVTKAKVRRLAAFAIGIMLYDFGIKPAARSYFARKVKRENIELDGIQFFLKFLKDGMALGRPRAAFAFGFMMHMEQVNKALKGHPLHAMVGEILFDADTFQVNTDGYRRFRVEESEALGYEYDPNRFDTVYQGKTEREIRNLKNSTVGEMDFETAMDVTGLAPFGNAMKTYIAGAVNNPQHPKHAQVLTGLGISRPQQFDPSKFRFNVNPYSESITTSMYYNGRLIFEANRREIEKDSHYNALVEVRSSFQALGAGMHMTASQIDQALKHGRKRITVSAALDGGYRTWNKFGFESKKTFEFIYHGASRVPSRLKPWLAKSSTAKLNEMGHVDRQEILGNLLKEMIRKYRMTFGGASTPPPPNPNPPLPADATADVLKIIEAVRNVYDSWSANMRDTLARLGLPTTTDRTTYRRWYASNTVTKQQQQGVHDYFLNHSPNFGVTFRSQWGYPPATTTSSQPSRATSTQVESKLKGFIESWGWFGGNQFSAQNVLSLIDSAQFDVVHGYTQLPELIDYMRKTGIEESSELLRGESRVMPDLRLTPLSQKMQDCMDIEGFSDWWYDNGRDWSGELDFTDGKYSIAVLAMDHYRKMKVKHKPEIYALDPAFQRTRVANLELKKALTGVLDSDILDSLGKIEDDNCGGGILKIDIAFMEQAVRLAKIEKKNLMRSTNVRVASRWLGDK